MDLSVIILSYNTKDLTKQCLDALVQSLKKTSLHSEIIVVDNASKDESVQMLKEYEKNNEDKNIHIELILNSTNNGYPKGNNQAIKVAKGDYILLLNSDAIIENVDFENVLNYMKKNQDIGVLTVKLNLLSGRIDPASHRGFPTPWNAFCYYSKLEKVFGKIPLIGRLVAGYHLSYKNLNSIHEIDSPTGAFFLSPRKVLEEVDGFDDDNFFMYGEDLDLAYRIKEKGYKVIYYPLYTAVHMKHHSGLKGQDPEVRKRTRKNFFESMKIFYNKHYKAKYPALVTKMVFKFIDFKQNHL